MRLKYGHRNITMTLTQTMCLNHMALHTGKKRAYYAKVGALAPVLKKSATELKHKQKLLKCKSTIQIATFNVRSLNRIGQQLELTASVVVHDIDIVCMQEHRYYHSEVYVKYHDTGNGWMFISTSAGKNSVNAVIGGVGMLLSPCTLKSLYSIEKIQPRIIVATFNGNPGTMIISCYNPTKLMMK